MVSRFDSYTASACERFDAICREHTVAKWAIQSVATADPVLLATVSRINTGFRQTSVDSTDKAEEWIEIASQIATPNGFQQLRINLLISLCGAAEQALKAFFVDGVLNRTGVQKCWAEISKKQCKAAIANDSEIDHLFALADNFFCSATLRKMPFAQRVQLYVNDYCAISSGKIFALTATQMVRLNLAFKTRNSILHRSGYPRLGKSEDGNDLVSTAITLTRQDLLGYVEVLREFVAALLGKVCITPAAARVEFQEFTR